MVKSALVKNDLLSLKLYFKSIFDLSHILNLCLENDQYILMHPRLTEADFSVYSTLKRKLETSRLINMIYDIIKS